MEWQKRKRDEWVRFWCSVLGSVFLMGMIEGAILLLVREDLAREICLVNQTTPQPVEIRRVKRQINDDKITNNEAGSDNLWYQYLKFTARTITKDNCLVCSKARPTLEIWPLPFNSSECAAGGSRTLNGTLCTFWCLM